jgi:hypothetical protein
VPGVACRCDGSASQDLPESVNTRPGELPGRAESLTHQVAATPGKPAEGSLRPPFHAPRRATCRARCHRTAAPRHGRHAERPDLRGIADERRRAASHADRRLLFARSRSGLPRSVTYGRTTSGGCRRRIDAPCRFGVSQELLRAPIRPAGRAILSTLTSVMSASSSALRGAVSADSMPVSRLVRRSWTGRIHPPLASASIRIASAARGRAIRSALVVRPVMRPHRPSRLAR